MRLVLRENLHDIELNIWMKYGDGRDEIANVETEKV